MELEKELKELKERIDKFDQKSIYWLNRWTELNKKGKDLQRKIQERKLRHKE